MKKAMVLLTLALVAVGCGGGDTEDGKSLTTPSASPSAEARTSVALTLTYDFTPGDDSGISRQNDEIGAACGTSGLTSPSDGLAFMEPGATITVTDGAGELIGKGTLNDSGAQTEFAPGPPIAFTCEWAASVSGVPTDRDFYTVLVNDNKVGDFSKEEFITDGPVAVSLTP